MLDDPSLLKYRQNLQFSPVGDVVVLEFVVLKESPWEVVALGEQASGVLVQLLFSCRDL